MTSFAERVSLAAGAVRQLFPETPLQENDYLSRKTGARVLLKREDLTPVRSYKIRGALNFFRKTLAAGNEAELFVCASAGNHAQGFAFVCRHFAKRGVVFMPVTTPQQKIDKTRLFGGEFVEIKLVGDFFDDCYRAALEFCESSGGHMVPPFDHKDIIEGQATVALEIAAQMPNGRAPDMVLLPVGGGGLSAGVTRYFAETGAAPRFVFCEPAGAPSLRDSLATGKRVKLAKVDNFVDGAAVGELGREPLRLLKDFPADSVHLVPENRLCATMIEMLNIEGVVLEPAGALAIDTLKDFSKKELKGKTVVAVVSGGNFDFERLPDVKERALRFEGLKKYFIIRFPQRPGALRDFLELMGPDDDITRFEYLKKSARNFGSVLIGIETKDRRNFDLLKARFDVEGVQYQDITDNETLGGFII
ncbi:threonine ammonia-lyase IlvA [Aminobacter sp. NyZ550]|jgi:threonine dehydratase|uniref:L-threonine dehydratase n=1 Tax=Aminobacter ciceronei TaxID=150723 RepID=A0ABR6C6M5_9HYPH|nr:MULTISPECIES: threonine ammonia-lyase IlvA [Aminobacter]WMC94761.1 threonine ammonia-lyase IlvA [Aminobacter aminovorans]MBA8906498.1 threonine dehydratase [Aminobacter ciceronei]MBA9020376.1 threonine dehydratase [Aminobacter ciceronei]MRX31780.1 threonine ammonia-lyase IlvA [Aminobacter sp. MDW-2]QNH32259.1 threonine ammonia-lyase IlvA [Aminobacter sp. MDW-2]